MTINIDITNILRAVFLICALVNIVSSYFAYKAKKAYEKTRDELMQRIQEIGEAEWKRFNRQMGNIQMQAVKVVPIRNENE